MAGLLRIAIGLDRGHRQVVQGVRCSLDGPARKLTIAAVAPSSVDAALELYTADARKELAVDAFRLDVAFELVTS